VFGRSSKNNRPERADQPYLIQWHGKPVDLTRQVAALKKKGLAKANRLEGEAREQVLNWAFNLVLPAYEDVLSRADAKPQAVRDAAELPCPRSDIKLAVLLGIMAHESSLLAQSGYLDKLYLAYTRLADFQKIEPQDKGQAGDWPPDSPAQRKYLACVRDDYAKLTRELQEFCAWLGI
jgi:hypothetical protein